MENKTEKYISILQLKIDIMKAEINEMDKDDKIATALATQYTQGLMTALRSFKILNDR